MPFISIYIVKMKYKMKQFPFNGTIMVINRTRAEPYRTNLHGEMEYRSLDLQSCRQIRR